jgi:hypothetical protein
MSLNRFLFQPVTNPVFPGEGIDLSSDEDPRRDVLYVHPGYDAVLDTAGGERRYTHQRTGRSLSHDEYRNETRMLDRALDERYYPDTQED